MLRTENANMNLSGAITNADGVNLANLNSSYMGMNDVHFNISVADYEAAIIDKAEFLKDVAAFIEQMLATVVDLND